MVKSSKKVLAVLLAVACLITFMPAMASQSFAAKKTKKTVKITKVYHKGTKTNTVTQGKYWTLRYKVTPGKTAVKWKTSNSNVTLSKKGPDSYLARFKKPGKASVTAYVKSNKKKKVVWNFNIKAAAKNAIVIDTTNVTKEYGLATRLNKKKADLTKAELLKQVKVTVDGKDVTSTLTEDNVKIGKPIVKRIIKTNHYNGVDYTEATYPVTFTYEAKGKKASKTVNVTVENQAPKLNTKDVAVAINKDKETTKKTITESEFIEKAVTSVEDYESFESGKGTYDEFVAISKGWNHPNKVEITKVVNAEGKTIDWNAIRVAEATTYTVTLKATDFLGGTSTADVKLTVQPNNAPTIATTAVKLDKADLNATNIKKAIFDQLTYDDAEDGTGVKASDGQTTVAGLELRFQDADTNTLFTLGNDTPTKALMEKVKYVSVTGLKDKDGASAQAKRLTVSFVSAPVITVKDNEGTKADIARVYIPYVSENTHQAPMTLKDAYAYISATYEGSAMTLVTPFDVAADQANIDAQIKAGTLAAGTKTALKANLTADKDTFSLDPRHEGQTETVTFTVTAKDATGLVTTATKKVIFKVVAAANKDAQKTFDAKVDAGNTTTPSAPTTPVFNDEGQQVNKITVTATKDTAKKSATAEVKGAATSATITYQWYYQSAGSKDWKVCGEASAKSATITDVNTALNLKCVVTVDGAQYEAVAK
ncbi:hypothetical protein ACTNEM_07150 [Eubacterium pyruvativorans]|uniref:hypothetical protein n=1 Tax=Eubacterium pyruvativorans TaxID=155865 RepID=UPI003F8B9F47